MGGYLMWGTEWVTNAKKRYKENRAHATKANDEAHQVARKQDPQIPHAENGGGDATSRAKNGKDSEFPRRDYKKSQHRTSKTTHYRSISGRNYKIRPKKLVTPKFLPR